MQTATALSLLLFTAAAAGQADVFGQVIDKFTRLPLSGVRVDAHRNTTFATSELVGSTLTAADGHYSFLIPPGNNIVFSATRDGYFLASVGTSIGASPRNINFEMDPELYGALLVALVDRRSGQPIAGTDLELIGSWTRRSAVTAADGKARFQQLRADDFSLCAFDEDDGYIDGCFVDPQSGVSDSVELLPGEARSVEVQLDAGLSIEGVVTDRLTNLPLANTEVLLVLFDGTSGLEVASTVTSTGAQGEYRVQGIEPGQYRVLALASPGKYPYYERRLYGDVRCTPDGCPAGQGTVIDLSRPHEGIDFRLGPSAVLSGKVIDVQSGAGVPGIEVRAMKYLLFSSPTIGKAVTDLSGRYAISHLPEADELRLGTSNMVGYFNQRWPGEPCTEADCDEGDDIVLGPGLKSEGFDFSLIRGPSISGTVSNRLTRRPARARLEIYNEQGQRIFVDLTDGGRYRTRALPVGIYSVRATNLNDAADCEYFRASPCSAGRAAATPVVIGAAGDAVSIDLSISEQVIAADGFESD